jgi:hypothetical protein
MRSVALQFLYNLGQRHGRRQRNKQMQMIGRPSSGEQQDLLLPRDSADILPQSGRIGNEFSAALGAENAMHEIAGVSVRHAPKDSGRIFAWR